MILELSIANFGSICDEQIVSFEPDTEIDDTTDFPLGTRTVLPVVAIFGANGAGKSTLVRAFYALGFVLIRERTPDELLDFPIHRLHTKCATAPICLQFRALLDGHVFRYRVEILDGAIVKEQLFRDDVPVLERALNEATLLPPELASDPIARQVRARLHSTSSLLRIAATYNQEDATRVTHFAGDWYPVLQPENLTRKPLGLLLGASDARAFVDPFVSAADVGISSIHTTGGDVRLMHRGQEGTVEFEMHEESAGTQRLLQWMPMVLNLLHNGGVLFVDELGAHLHHWMVRDLIETFQNPATNPNQAQLVLTTHDPLFFDTTLLRTDQMVLVEKSDTGATRIFAASDFSDLPTDEPLVRSYLTGALGGTPRIRNLWAHLAPTETAE